MRPVSTMLAKIALLLFAAGGFYLLAERRLRHMYDGRSARKAPGLDDLDEVSKLAKLHSGTRGAQNPGIIHRDRHFGKRPGCFMSATPVGNARSELSVK